MAKLQPSKLAMRVRFPLPAFSQDYSDMKVLRCLAIVFCLGVFGPLPQVYAGAEKAGAVFPRNLSVEELAKMVYEAAKKDSANAPLVFMDALSSRDSWTRSELLLLSDALLLAVPSLTPGDIPSLVVGSNVKPGDVQYVVEQLSRNDGGSPYHVIQALPPDVPVYPVIPSPGPVSGLR